MEAFSQAHLNLNQTEKDSWVSLWKATAPDEMAKQLTQTALNFRVSEAAISNSIKDAFGFDVRQYIKGATQ